MPRYLTLQSKVLESLYDAAPSLEAAQEITQVLVTERRALREFLEENPETQLPGKPTIAVQLNLWTAVVGLQKTAKKDEEAARENEEDERIQYIHKARDLATQELIGVA